MRRGRATARCSRSRESTFQLGSGEVGRLDKEGRDVVAAEVGHREAEGAQDARRSRHVDASDPKLLREAAGVQPSRSAEGDERELARIDTSLDADDPQGARHLRLGDRDHTVRGDHGLDPELGRETLDRALGVLASQDDLPAECRAVLEVAEVEVGVGDRDLVATAGRSTRARVALPPSAGLPAGHRRGRPRQSTRPRR